MVVIIITITTFIIGYLLYKWRTWRYLPPGPWGLPVVGYLPFLDREQPHRTLSEFAEKYGGIFSIGMGSVVTIVLSDHKLVKEAFAREELSGRAPLYLTHGIMEGNGIICAEGPLWKDQRKLVSIWLKNFSRNAGRQEVDRKVGNNVHILFEEMLNMNGASMDLSSMVTNALGSVVNELVFGCTFPPGDQTWQWLRQVQEEGCHEMSVAGVVNFLPFIRFFSKSVKKTMDFIQQGQRQTHRVYSKIISMKRELLGLKPPPGSEYELHSNLDKEHPDGLVKCVKYSKKSPSTEWHYFDPSVLKFSTGDCILDNFLREQKKRFENNDESAIFTSDKQLLYLLADLFGAGLDTTSVTLSWFLLFMALYQDEQDLVRKELLEQYPDDDSAVDSSRLPRLMAALSEVQRIRSIVPMGIPHGCMQDCQLAGYLVPKGAMVVALQWALHMNPTTWKEPDSFNPSRFISTDGSPLRPEEFLPFQTGKRMCPGDEISRTLSAGVMARLLRKWRVRIAAPPTDMRGHVGVTLGPEHVLYECQLIKK